MDVEYIPRRKVKEKEGGEVTESWQHDLEQSTGIACDEVLRWTMQQRNIDYAVWEIRKQVIEENMFAERGGKRNDREMMSSAQQWKED